MVRGIVTHVRADEAKKRARGQYYTAASPFSLPAFRRWAAKIGLKDMTVLEPFAGANNIPKMLVSDCACGSFVSYDISPQDPDVQRKNTLRQFPKNFEVCITNPPWLGRYAAKRRGLAWPDIQHDDLYKHCLELALNSCPYVAFIIPATFLQSCQFRERLEALIFINGKMFTETDNPVCLALFGSGGGEASAKIYNGCKYLGTVRQLEKHVPVPSRSLKIRFNCPRGDLGLYGIDNTKEPSIRFCRGYEIVNEIKHSSRSITRISIPFRVTGAAISRLNSEFFRFRRVTHDVFLTPFKGLRQDGLYRRRLDYDLARRFINEYV